MHKKIVIGSILAAGLIILAASVTVAINVNTVQSNTVTIKDSPLFTQRTLQSTNKQLQEIHVNYIGKNKPQNLFFSQKSTIDRMVDQAVRLITQNPAILDKIFTRMQKMPSVTKILSKYGLTQKDAETYLNQIKQDPELLNKEIEKAKLELLPGGKPLSLNTSNPFGCIITIIALLPVIVFLALFIATITIITCLNIGGCFEAIGQNLIDNFIQRLTP